MRPLHVVLAVLVCAAGARAQEDEKALATELEKLDAECTAREREFWKPFIEAKNDEERNKLDLSKNPRPDFAPRFLALSRRGKGTELGFKITCSLAGGQGLGKEDHRAVLHELETTYVAFPKLESQLCLLLNAGYSAGYDEVARVLSSIAAAAPGRGVKAAAGFTLGELRERSNEPERAKEAFRAVASDFASTPWAAKARARIFVLEHLALGMVAPDFEAEDEKGEKFKLSDYRGKVVVLDFWGFW